jgi:uncharacterized protein (DUF1697 family)
MARYGAFLRGVSPVNLKMKDLKPCLEAAGFGDVRTVRSSGNAVFEARAGSEAAIERKAEAAMKKHLGRSFLTIVRSIEALRAMLAADPYRSFRLKPGYKRVVTFLREEPAARLRLPIEVEGSRILRRDGKEVFTAYLPSPKGAAFMSLLEKTFGQQITTRSWDTIEKMVVP